MMDTQVELADKADNLRLMQLFVKYQMKGKPLKNWWKIIDVELLNFVMLTLYFSQLEHNLIKSQTFGLGDVPNSVT